MIYFSSDPHFGHDRDFIWKARGFDNIQDMNETIVERYNSRVGEDDDFYILGDLVVGNIDEGLDALRRVNGHKKIILGNHDTLTRIELYREIPDLEIIGYSTLLRYHNKRGLFYLSHYPALCGNFRQHGTALCLAGHTHSKNVWGDVPGVYNVAVDAHDCYPVSAEEIREFIKNLGDGNENNDNL